MTAAFAEGGDANTQYIGCCFYSYTYFFKDIQEGYWQLLHYVKEDISGVAAIFDSLMAIAYAAEKLDRQIIDGKYESILAIEPYEEDE